MALRPERIEYLPGWRPRPVAKRAKSWIDTPHLLTFGVPREASFWNTALGVFAGGVGPRRMYIWDVTVCSCRYLMRFLEYEERIDERVH
jgi:hypothetical protein